MTMQATSPDQRARPTATAFVNARLIDPSSRLDQRGGVLIRDDLIVDVGAHIAADTVGDANIVDCDGRVLAPGLIDMMVFTGEPGHEHRETLATASRAAAAGGVTTIVCMPNTDPVIDDVALVDFILRRARDTALVHVHPMAAMTKGLIGEEISEIGLLSDAGAIAFAHGKTSLASAKVMRNVLAYAAIGEQYVGRREGRIAERTFVEVRRRTKVIGRFPGETSALSLIWAVLELSSRGWRGVKMNPKTVAEIERLRRRCAGPSPTHDRRRRGGDRRIRSAASGATPW